MFPFKPNTPYPDMLHVYAQDRANMRTVTKIAWAPRDTGPQNKTKWPDAPQLRGARPAQAGSKKPAFNACEYSSYIIAFSRALSRPSFWTGL